MISSRVFPSATGSGYRVLIGFHRDRCDFRDLNYRSSAGCGQIWDWIAHLRPPREQEFKKQKNVTHWISIVNWKRLLRVFKLADDNLSVSVRIRRFNNSRLLLKVRAELIVLFCLRAFQINLTFQNWKSKLKWLYLFIDETLGTVSLSQTPSARSRSLISQANIVGFCRL